MTRRLTLIALATLTWPLIAAAVIEPVLSQAEQLGAALGSWQSYAAAEAVHDIAPPTAEELAIPLGEEELVGEFTEERPNPVERTTKRSPSKPSTAPRAQARSKLAVPKHGLRVRQASILRLAKARAVPTGQPVAAQGQRPAGLQLLDASRLGVGMQDGDIITHVAGTPVQSKSEIVNLVLQARAQRAPQISARFFRGQEPWMLIVELPYPEPRAP